MKKNAVKFIILTIIMLNVLLLAFPACTSTKINDKIPDNTGPPPINNEDGERENGEKTDKDNNSGNRKKDKDEDRDEENNENNNENNNKRKREIKVKALYLTGWVAGNSKHLKHYVNLAQNTEINSYVIDIKDDDGYVGYKSEISEVNRYNTWKYKYNADNTIKTLHDNEIYVIGRLVCFKDPVLSIQKPELAIKNKNGGLWRDNQNIAWLNPYNKNTWPYLINIAREALQKGFDEIQFDYVRFPNDGDKKAMQFSSDKKKYEIINEFLSYGRKKMPDAILSADVFGIICESPNDTEDIGQYLEFTGREIDYICPMVYPSHYAAGQVVNGVKFDKPDYDPYRVVFNTLIKALERISKIEGYKARIRPYLQDFTASWLGNGNYQKYGAEQVRQQIDAVYDAGLDEWILWDSNNSYSENALK